MCVVLGSQPLVRENLVRFGDVLELLLGLLIAGVLIRVEPERLLVVGLLDLIRRRVELHTEQVVVTRLLGLFAAAQPLGARRRGCGLDALVVH